MKKFNIFLLALLCGLLANGCLWKGNRVPTRTFVLTVLPAEPAPAVARPVEVEVGAVKMPSYLLRESLVVRKSANELAYLDNARWAERLDQGFRRTLKENLSTLLASREVHLSSSDGAEPKLIVSVDVKQFDADSEGRGALLATWRIAASGSDKPVKTGQSHLNRAGPSPRGNPQVIANTLSGLTDQFSRELAEAIRAFASAGNG